MVKFHVKPYKDGWAVYDQTAFERSYDHAYQFWYKTEEVAQAVADVLSYVFTLK